MKKDKLYLYTLLAISLIVFIIGYFSMNFLVETTTKNLLEIQINSSKREAREFSKLISYQLENNVQKEVLIKNIQKSIENANFDSGFVCMFDWSGVEICHPNPKNIGRKTNPSDSFVQSVDNELNVDDFYNLLNKKEEIGGLRSFKNSDRDSEIIYLYPVKNSDWIVAAHANINGIEKHLNQLKLKFILIYGLSSLLIILFSLITVRLIGSFYEKGLEDKNEELMTEVLNLKKRNANVIPSKKKKAEVLQQDNKKNDTENASPKNRIITYLRDQIITIDTNEIAYIQIENTVTKITSLKGTKYSSNSSLEELYNSFNKTQFFRVNRQYIVSINAIDKILRYGNSQLKIITKPISEKAIIISKNKASKFKKWLNK